MPSTGVIPNICLRRANRHGGGQRRSFTKPFCLRRCLRIGSLSKRNDPPQNASRPFDLHRDGIVLSEGAGAVVLEELEQAEERNATIYAEVLRIRDRPRRG